MEESLLILFVLMCKHAVADLAIQSFRKPSTKRLYFNKGLHVHSLDHGILTFAVLLFWISPLSALCYAIFDYVAHWHIDWTKSNILHKFKIKRLTPAFWRLQTLDQIGHYATYAFIVYLITDPIFDLALFVLA